MTNHDRKPRVMIMRTPHGKPLYENASGVDEDDRDSPLYDALDFPGKRGLDDLEAKLKGRYPGIRVLHGRKGNFVADLRSMNRKVSKVEFMSHWRNQLTDAPLGRPFEFNDPFRRAVPVRLYGKDRVRPWSGWFHYPLLIEDSRRQMKESGERLQSLFEQVPTKRRDVIEEAYFEQVLRERLAIFERRREWWRIIRWGATTALGLVLACWSGIQIWDRFFGG